MSTYDEVFSDSTIEPSFKLGDKVAFLSGFAFDSSKFNSSQRGMPVIRIRDVIRGYTETYFDGEYDPRYEVQNGDYLIGMDGEFNIAKWSGGPALLNQRVCKLDSVPSDLDRDFLARFLPRVLKKIEDATPFVTVKHLSIKDLKSIDVPKIPLEDQKRIAALLDKADALRRKRQEALRLTDDFLRSTFLDMFEGYLDKNASDPFADVLAIPLNNGFFAKNDQYGSGTPVIWVDNLYHTSLINTSSLRRAEMTANDLRKYAVLEGDLLFTRSSLVRDGIGQCNVVPSLAEPMAFECHIIRARVDLKKANPRYIQALYRTEFGKAEILRLANTATMTTISQGSLEALPCPLPPIGLQNRYAAIVQAVEKTASSMAATLESNNTLFSALQQRAFSGQL